jgi:hypothetical protein
MKMHTDSWNFSREKMASNGRLGNTVNMRLYRFVCWSNYSWIFLYIYKFRY